MHETYMHERRDDVLGQGHIALRTSMGTRNDFPSSSARSSEESPDQSSKHLFSTPTTNRRKRRKDAKKSATYIGQQRFPIKAVISASYSRCGMQQTLGAFNGDGKGKGSEKQRRKLRKDIRRHLTHKPPDLEWTPKEQMTIWFRETMD